MSASRRPEDDCRTKGDEVAAAEAIDEKGREEQIGSYDATMR